MKTQGGVNLRRPTGREGHRPRLSVLVLVYNEREVLETCYERLRHTLDSLTRYDQEVIFVDDGSTDGSFEILLALRGRDLRVKILRLSRNFGSWNAIAAGIDAAGGEAVAWLTSDLQDPPELLTPLVRRWEEGADVVWAVREGRDDPLPRRLAAGIFYRLLRRLALPDYPPDGMDICLLDRQVARIFAGLKERHRFTQALIMQLGFTQARVPYRRERRQRGRSKWGHFTRLFSMGLDMMVAVSPWPLRAMLYLGLLLLLPGTALLAIGSVGAAVGRPVLPPWALVAAAAGSIAGLNAAALGVMGEYVWRILEGVRERPLYIVRERIGFDPAASPRERAPDERTATREQR